MIDPVYTEEGGDASNARLLRVVMMISTLVEAATRLSPQAVLLAVLYR